MSQSFKRDLLVFSIIFGLLTIPFLVSNLDIMLQQPFFDAASGWYLMNVPFWDFIYKYGIFLGYFVTVGALILVSLTYWKKSLVQWRKAAWFMLFVMVVGPGILVNGTFKEHWGRPRPREITEFGGNEKYVKVLVKGKTNGKSFPCGHASMGFYLSIPFLFLRNRNRKLAWILFIFGTIYGGLIGYARMVAGGHFASDVVWAAAMVWFTAILGFHLFKIDKPIDTSHWEDDKQKKKGLKFSIILGVFIPIFTLGILLATPYISKKEFSKSNNELQKIDPAVIKTTFTEGTINLTVDSFYQVNYAVNGFGFPNSKIRLQWMEGDTCVYYLDRMGWFTEVRNNIQMKVPTSDVWENHLTLKEGKVLLTVPSDTTPFNLSILVEKGEVFLKLGSNNRVNYNIESPNILNEINRQLNSDKSLSSKVKIVVVDGKIVLQ